MKNGRNVASKVVVAVAGIVLVTVVILVVNAEAGFAGCTVAYPFGWLAPLIAAGILGLATWVLLGERGSSSGDVRADTTQCTRCGREVLGQWRMCPYCGAMLEPSARGQERPAGSASR